MSGNFEALTAIDAALTENLKDAYLEYATEIDTINSTDVNLLAEVEFIEVGNLDQIIATSTFSWQLFHRESPMLPYRELLEADGEASRMYAAKLLHLHFYCRIRENLGRPLSLHQNKVAWLKREERPPLAIPLHQSSEYKLGETADYHCSDEEIRQIAELLEKAYPEESAYFRLVVTRAKSMGFTGLNKVGQLISFDVRLGNVYEHITGRIIGASVEGLRVKKILGWGGLQ